MHNLKNSATDKLQKNGYSIGESFSTMSSVFYPLKKSNREYLLKIDTTQSGSLEHQTLLTKAQKKLGIPYMNCINNPLKDEYLILDKITDAQSLKKVQTTELVIEWGRQLRKIHQITADNHQLWDNGSISYDDLINVQNKDIIAEYVHTAMDNLRYINDFHDEVFIRKAINFINTNLSKIDAGKSFVHGDSHRNNVLVVNNQPLIFDPNGIILYGSPYIDLAVVAFEYPGYFNQDWNKADNDTEIFSAFLEGYGEIDFEQLYYYLCIRGVQRYRHKDKTFLKSIDKVAQYAFERLT